MNATLAILRNTDAYTFIWNQRNRSVHASGGTQVTLRGNMPVSQAQIDGLNEQIAAAAQTLNLGTYNQNKHDTSLTEQSSVFASLGRVLFSLVPDPIRTQIRALVPYSTLEITTSDTSLPWELMHDGSDFLALQHCMARALLLEQPQPKHQVTQPADQKVHCLLIADPTSELAAADDEIATIARTLQTARERVQFEALYSAQKVESIELRERLASQKYRLIHFAGHARPGELLLADGSFHSADIVNAVRNHPVVVLNACASAQSLGEDGADIEMLTKDTASLASAFISGGAVAVVGMLWPVPDEIMQHFGRELYRQFVRGLPIGEALRQSRESMHQSDANGVSWLAPILYGAPDEIVIPARTIERMATALSIRFDADPEKSVPGYQEPAAWESIESLAQICQSVESFGGKIIYANSVNLLATFGLHQSQGNDALQAVRAARDVRAAMDSLGNKLPIAAVASGKIVALASGIISEAVQSPRLSGKPLHDLQALFIEATSGQIIVDQETQERCREQYTFQERTSTVRALPEALQYKLVSSPLQTAQPTNSTLENDTIVRDASVGRTDDLKQLHRAWKGVCKGQGQIVGISGEAGVGKTHLVSQFQNSFEAETPNWLRTACTPDVSQRPYGLLARFFRTLLELSEYPTKKQVEETLQARFAHFRPLRESEPQLGLLTDLLGIVQQDLQIQEKSVYQHQLNELLEHLLVQALEQGPLLYILEDTHWADAASMEVLMLLGSDIESIPLLVMLLHRPEWRPPWQGQTYFQSINLKPLNADASQKLIGAVLGTSVFPDELYPLVARTGGNPLFITEILTSLMERGLLVEEHATPATPETQGGWLLRGNIEPADLPTNIQRTIEVRLARLTESQREALHVASVIGADVQPAPLSHCLRLSQDALLDLLDELRKGGFLRRIFGGRYEFRHALIRDVAYTRIPSGQRREWHRQVGEALEQEGAQQQSSQGHDSVAALADHYYRSLFDDDQKSFSQADHVNIEHAHNEVVAEKARSYLMQAGQSALDRYGGKEAAALYKRAYKVAGLLELLPEQQANISTGLGDAQRLLNNSQEAMKAYQSAHGVLHTVPLAIEGRLQAASMARKLARLQMERAHYEIAEAWILSGLNQVQNSTNHRYQASAAMLYIQQGSVSFNQGNYTQAIRYCKKGLEIAQTCQDSEATAEGNFLLGAALMPTGQLDDAAACFKKCLTIREEQRNLLQIHRILTNIGIIYMYQGKWLLALGNYEKALGFFKKINDLSASTSVHINAALVQQYLGNWQEAEEHLQQALVMASKVDNPRLIVQVHSNLGTFLVLQGQWETAHKHLTLSIRLLKKHGIEAHRADVKAHLALVEMSNNNFDSAIALVTHAIAFAKERDEKLATAIALRIYSRILLHTNEFAQALVQIHQSLKILYTINEEYERARSIYWMAVVYFGAGDLPHAEHLCSYAREIFEPLGAKKDLSAVNQLLTDVSVKHNSVNGRLHIEGYNEQYNSSGGTMTNLENGSHITRNFVAADETHQYSFDLDPHQTVTIVFTPPMDEYHVAFRKMLPGEKGEPSILHGTRPDEPPIAETHIFPNTENVKYVIYLSITAANIESLPSDLYTIDMSAD